MRLRRIIALAAAFVLALRLSAQTPCDSLTVPLREAFDTYGAGSEVMPPCWFATRNYDMGYPPHVDALQHYSGTASLVLYPGTLAESHYSMVIAPPLAGISSLEGLFGFFEEFSREYSVDFVIEVNTDEECPEFIKKFVN